MTRTPRLPLRLAAGLGVLLALLALGLLPRATPVAEAVVTATKTCTGPEGGGTATIGELVLCDLLIDANPPAPVPEIPPGTTITITALGSNYVFTEAVCSAGAGDCDVVSVTSTSITIVCAPAPSPACADIEVEEVIEITSLASERVTQQVTLLGQTVTATATAFRIVAPGTTVFVSTRGDDENNCRTRGQACATLNRALIVADDGDSVLLEGGTYDIRRTVVVDKLVTIEPDGTGVKVILKARPGVIIFDVRAPGGQNRHVIIRNFTLGGNYRDTGAEPVIRLSGDSYTEINNNIIGGFELPINNGIVIGNSLRPHVHDNTFIGNTQAVGTPLLVVGQTVTGFGVASVECLGLAGLSVSSEVQVINNSFTGLWTAGIWLCADGGGAHNINGNVFRNYWRGIVFKDVTDSKITGNTLVGGGSDGVIVYGASVNVLVENNRIESNIGVDAAGLRVGWVADPLVPRANTVVGNRISRASIGVHVFGAQTTVMRNNTISVTGTRTGILLTPAIRPLDPATQPINTEIRDSIVIADGPCAAGFGCALRLLGVTVPVTAINNDWGLRTVPQVEGVIWHKPDDPLLGQVEFTPFQFMVAGAATPPPTVTTPVGAPPSSPPPSPSPLPSPSPASSSASAAAATGRSGAVVAPSPSR